MFMHDIENVDKIVTAFVNDSFSIDRISVLGGNQENHVVSYNSENEDFKQLLKRLRKYRNVHDIKIKYVADNEFRIIFKTISRL